VRGYCNVHTIIMSNNAALTSRPTAGRRSQGGAGQDVISLHPYKGRAVRFADTVKSMIVCRNAALTGLGGGFEVGLPRVWPLRPHAVGMIFASPTPCAT